MNEYQIASIVSGFIAISWILAYLLCWAGQWAWAWVDDSKVGQRNLIVKYLANKNGFDDYDSSCFDYRGAQKGLSDGFGSFIRAYLFTVMLPFILVITINFYPVTLAFLCVALIAWVARFSRRHKKLFDKHVVDKDAHN
jgi:hypothetical protein